MNTPWIKIKHLDDSYKIFFTVKSSKKMFDLASDELKNVVDEQINICKEEIKKWNRLLDEQTKWIESREN